MPVYEQSYRHWQGVLNPNVQKWFIVARMGIKMLWRRWIIVLVIIASIPFMVRVAQIYIVTRLGSEPQFAKFVQQFQVDPGLFERFLGQQSFFMIFIVILAGAGLISKDKKFNALQLYFSKPLSPLDYLLGKFTIIGFYTSLVTLIPALLLFIIKILLSENLNFLTQNFWIPFSILGYFILTVLVYGGLILALSSLGKGARFAGISFFAIIGFSKLVKTILSSMPNAGAVSLDSDLQQVSNFLFGQPPSFPFSTWLAFGVLVGVSIISLLILKKQIRGTEVVK